VLPPGERCRAKVINVLLPGNVKDGSRKSAVTGTKTTGEYYHRGNVIRRKP